MDRVLVVSSNEKAAAAVISMVREAFPACRQSVVDSGIEARRIASENNYDAVIINCPLSDEYGNELAELFTESSMASCIMIVKAENADAIRRRQGRNGQKNAC